MQIRASTNTIVKEETALVRKLNKINTLVHVANVPNLSSSHPTCAESAEDQIQVRRDIPPKEVMQTGRLRMA